MTEIIHFAGRPAGQCKRQIPLYSAVAAAKLCLFLAVLLMGLAPAASGQALPAAEASPISTGFALPTTAGTLQYSVSASESISWGYYGNGGASAFSNLTGDVAYISNSKRDPFSMVFTGGHSWSSSGQSSFSFLNLGLSQVVNAGRWSFVLSDTVSFMPSTPTTGLSGIAGIGDLGLNPVQVGPVLGQGALTNYSRRVANTVAVSVQRPITGKTSVNASGYYGITRFIDNSGGPSNGGLDSEQESGSVGLNHQFDVRNSVGGNYSYSNYSYSGNNFGIPLPGFVSQTATAQFSHQFTRKLSVSVSAGPQFTTINSAPSTSSLGLFADASAGYAGHFSSVSLSYVRSTNSGYGLLGGALSDSVAFTASRLFARVWNGSFTSSYTRTSSLSVAQLNSYSLSTTLAGVQVSRAIARSLSGYASYTIENQSNRGNGSRAVDVFSGLSQVVGFGITYSPMSIHAGRP